MSVNNIAQLISKLKSLKLWELEVLASLEHLVTQTEKNQGTLITPAQLSGYSVGDQVVITNKV
jgi:hypothetical protein